MAGRGRLLRARAGTTKTEGGSAGLRGGRSIVVSLPRLEYEAEVEEEEEEEE